MPRSKTSGLFRVNDIFIFRVVKSARTWHKAKKCVGQTAKIDYDGAIKDEGSPRKDDSFPTQGGKGR
jgi:hypothetical protein